ncbi:signal peptidase II [Bacillus cereus]|nr:signal peptidase II [Bacillus cereus]MCC2461890.1 signal peptidase II [Bacillus mobilis]MDR4143004.1 signal peptidase II [Bacillus paranthracis]WDL95088.1 signal peptidase II [Bacillus sp. HNR-4]HDR7933694.1 signal peptidase II [Bacillus pacificus]
MILYIIALIAVLIDQLAKYAVRTYMQLGETIPIAGDYFQLTSHRNNGAAWGIFAGQRWFLILITLVAIIFLIRYARNTTDKWTRYALGLYMGGALGNAIDRIAFGEVVDFFNVRIINYPIFNTADTFLVCGTILLVITTFKQPNNVAKGTN